MTKVANCKAEVQHTGRDVAELRAFAAPGSWTNEKSESFAALVGALGAAGYRSLYCNVNTIGLQRKGQSAIYPVPACPRGALAAFAGKFVRIVCVDRTDKNTGRLFAFSAVPSTGEVTRAAREEGA